MFIIYLNIYVHICPIKYNIHILLVDIHFSTQKTIFNLFPMASYGHDLGRCRTPCRRRRHWLAGSDLPHSGNANFEMGKERELIYKNEMMMSYALSYSTHHRVIVYNCKWCSFSFQWSNWNIIYDCHCHCQVWSPRGALRSADARTLRQVGGFNPSQTALAWNQ